MLKKMRWRFIGAAMAAFATVVLILVVGMNLWNRHIIIQRQDDILSRLAEWETGAAAGPEHRQDRPQGPGRLDQQDAPPERDQDRQDKDFAMPGPFGGHSPEFRYSLRYFVVRCDETGVSTGTDREFIASVDAEQAAQWGEEVVKSGRTSGYRNGYRYLRQTTMEGSVVLFLNAEQEIQSMRIMLLVSSVVALVSLLVVFALVVLFSKRAIAPYARNIETQKRFITDASHELKTPLTAISASADVLSMDLPDNEWVVSIQAECARLARLVGDLVTLSRLDEAQPFPDKSEFSLSDTVWEIAEPAAAVAKARGLGYTQDIADGLTLCGDRAAVQQMASILLDNALKYTSPGGEVRLSLTRLRGKTQLEVFNTCDTAGLDLSRLFDRFYRSDTARAQQSSGNGVGLSIAQATAQRHGGSIAVKAGGGGLTFTVKL